MMSSNFIVSFVGVECPQWITCETHFFDVECTMQDAINSLRSNDFFTWSIIRISDGVMIAQSRQYGDNPEGEK